MILDLNGKGLEALWPKKPYKAKMMRKLWEDPEKGWTSGEMHKWLKATGVDTSGRVGISRASVINALNELVDEDGFIYYIERSGKGGYHRVYSPSMDLETFKKTIIYFTNQVTDRIFEGEWWTL